MFVQFGEWDVECTKLAAQIDERTPMRLRALFNSPRRNDR